MLLPTTQESTSLHLGYLIIHIFAKVKLNCLLSLLDLAKNRHRYFNGNSNEDIQKQNAFNRAITGANICKINPHESKRDNFISFRNLNRKQNQFKNPIRQMAFASAIIPRRLHKESDVIL